MKRNIFLSLLIFIIIVILNCLLGMTSAQEKSITIRMGNREYQVQEDGTVVNYDGTVVQDTSIIEKAHYTAMVTRERITESRYNQVTFAPVTKTMIDLQSLVKPLAGGYAYVLLSSMDITSSLLEGGAKGGPTGAFGNVAKKVTKDLILEVTKELVEHPEKTAMKMANDAYALGLQAYRENYATYRSVTKEGYILSYDDAVNFMANEQQKELLGVAVQLIRDINSKKYQVGQYAEDSHENQEIKQKILKLIAGMKTESLGTKVDIAIFMTEFKPIFEEALSGLENYKPYIDFEERASSLNNAFSKTEYAYYQYKEPSELDALDVAETNWDDSTILPPSEGSAKPEMVTWEKTFGGSEDDCAYFIIQTNDGDYAVAGWTESKGAGKDDFWITKLNSEGIIVWEKAFGGTEDDNAHSIVQTTDGGYAVAGRTEYKSYKEYDFGIIKLDEKGNMVWDKTYGESGEDEAYSLIQDYDGNYIVAGYTESKGAGEEDIWIIKLDSQGDILWDKTFGGSDNDEAWTIIQTNDGGYAISGYTESKGAGESDAWIITLDSQGDIIWDKTFGGSSYDLAFSLIQTTDGGYAIAGYTQSKGAGESDAWILKLDSQGNKLWDKTFGGSDNDEAWTIIQTNDGGYAISGYTESKGAGEEDAWILKLDNQGNLLWEKTFGGSDEDVAIYIIQTTDGGYAISGYTESKGAGESDAWILKLDKEGNLNENSEAPESTEKSEMVTWDKTFGWSNEDDGAYSLIQTNDGGYAVAGWTYFRDVNYYDVGVMKLDYTGNIEWDQTFGGSGYDKAYSIIQTTDGGYVIAGETSFRAAEEYDVFIIKLDSQGDMIWVKTYGGSDSDKAESIIQTTDGGYAIAGYTESKGAGRLDFWLIKLDSQGNMIWDKTYGGNGIDRAYSLIQTTDGGYAVGGWTESKGAGSSDAWVIKIDNQGNIVWDKTYGGNGEEVANSLIQTTDGGYAVAGYTSSKGVGKRDTWLIKLDSQGKIIWDKTYGGKDRDEAYSIVQTTDGGYAIAGETYSRASGQGNIWVMKLDHEGNITWERTYSGSDNNEVFSLIQTDDGGFAVAGYTSSMPIGGGEMDVWILKLDEQGNLSESSGALGDTGPAGGHIFYDKGRYSDGWRYLEAAPVSTEWKDTQWGSYGTLIGGTETVIGTGKSNTAKIVTWLNSHGETGRAAQLCDALVVENNGVTYSDWFLPSKDELNLMYENLKVPGVGSFADNNYLSSSEYAADFAWYQSLRFGSQYGYHKIHHFRVRAVRAF